MWQFCRIVLWICVLGSFLDTFLVGGPFEFEAIWALLIPQAQQAETNGVVLISGCSSGIGLDAAKRLASRGFWVVAGVRKPRDIEELRKITNIQPIAWDVTDDSSSKRAVEAAVNLAKEKKTRFIGLVANAGIGGDWGRPFEWETKETMQKRCRTYGTPRGTAYTTSKFALEGMVSAVRRELYGSGVSVSLVNAGCIRTDFFKKIGSMYDDVLKRNQTDPDYDLLLSSFVKYELYDMCDVCGGPTKETSDVIEHALTSHYPRAHYYPGTAFGPPARIIVHVGVLLPARLQDFYLAKLVVPQSWLVSYSWMKDREISFPERLKKILTGDA